VQQTEDIHSEAKYGLKSCSISYDWITFGELATLSYSWPLKILCLHMHTCKKGMEKYQPQAGNVIQW
jgi:hypothetical protein